jgi:hypothetical protein
VNHYVVFVLIRKQSYPDGIFNMIVGQTAELGSFRQDHFCDLRDGRGDRLGAQNSLKEWLVINLRGVSTNKKYYT